MSWFDECDLEYLIGDLKDKNAKLRNEVDLTKRMYANVSEDLCAEQADNERLRQELAICEESEQEKSIEYLRQENIDWEDRYRALAKENAKLRELVRSVLVLQHDSVFKWLDAAMTEVFGTSFTAQARELGVEVEL